MQEVPLPVNEKERLAALYSYDLLDTLPEKDFEELTLLASQICQTPVALISLIDDKRQWFKSIVGYEASQTPKEFAFCTHAIMNVHEVMIVKDARKDERFSSNPLVTDNPNIVFYAGVPLVNEDGYALGSLCVIDHQPKELNEQQIQSLKVLAKQVLTKMELKRKLAVLEKANEVLLESNSFIQKFAFSAAHDIKNPLTTMLLTSQALEIRLRKANDEKNLNLVNLNIRSTKSLLSLVDEMLEYSRAPSLLLSNQRPLNLNMLLQKVISMMEIPQNMTIILPDDHPFITSSTVALEQIFLNLLTNAVRYNDKQQGIIRILFFEKKDFYEFKVTDNGIGIVSHQRERIFEKNYTLQVTDRYNNLGTGIGLSTVKALVEKLQGKISLESTVGQGSTFTFFIKKPDDKE